MSPANCHYLETMSRHHCSQMIRGVPHLPHLGPKESFRLLTLFFTPQFKQEIIWNSGIVIFPAWVFVSSVKDFRKFMYVASFSMISTPMPFLNVDSCIFLAHFTRPLRKDFLPSGINNSISIIVSGTKLFRVLIKRPLSERLLNMPVKFLPPELNFVFNLLTNLGCFLLST